MFNIILLIILAAYLKLPTAYLGWVIAFGIADFILRAFDIFLSEFLRHFDKK